MAEKIILEVDVAGLANDIQTARVALDSYRIALERSVEENGKFSKEATIAKAQFDAQNKAVKQLEGQLLRVTQAQQANNAILKDLIKQGYDPATKSVDQNRKVLNALTAEYNRADKAGREKLAPTLKKISDELKKQEGAIGDTRRNVGNYQEAFVGAFSEISKGVPVLGQLQTAQQGVNAIMSANPIGGVVTLLTALFQIMQNNAEVADQVSFAFAGVNKFFGNIIDTVVDTVSSFDKLTAALKNPIDFIFNLGKNAATAAKEGFQAAQAFDDLTEKQAELNGLADISRSKAEGLAKTLKDRTKSEQERIKIAEQVANLEIDALNKLQQAKQAELQATNLQNKDRKLSGEERANVIKLQLELEQLAEEKNTAEKQKQTRINILLDKQLTDSKKTEVERRINIGIAETKAFENAIKKQQEEEDKAKQTREERELAAIVKRENIIAERIGTEQALVDAEILNRNFILQNTELTETERQNVILESENKIAAIRKKFRDDNAQLAKKDAEVSISGILSFVNSAISQIGSLISESTDQRLQELEAQVEAGVITQEEFNKRSKQLKQQAFEETKAINIVNAVISTAQAVLNAYNSGLQAGGPAGPAVGAVFAGIAAAIGAAQIGIISAQQPPKFAEGGSVFDVGGKPHSEGGTLYTGADGNRFEVERGEKIFVLKKSASRHIDALGGLNMAFGGRSWSDSPIRYAADGGMIQDGGFGIRQTSEQANTTAMLKQFAKSIVSEMPMPVVSVVEFERVQTDRNKSISVADL